MEGVGKKDQISRKTERKEKREREGGGRKGGRKERVKRNREKRKGGKEGGREERNASVHTKCLKLCSILICNLCIAFSSRNKPEMRLFPSYSLT